MSSIIGKIMQFSAVAKKGHLYNGAEIEKEAVGFNVMCESCGKRIHIRWHNLIF